MVRGWHVQGLAVRPDHRMIALGFLSPARRLARRGLPSSSADPRRPSSATRTSRRERPERSASATSATRCAQAPRAADASGSRGDDDPGQPTGRRATGLSAALLHPTKRGSVRVARLTLATATALAVTLTGCTAPAPGPGRPPARRPTSSRWAALRRAAARGLPDAGHARDDAVHRGHRGRRRATRRRPAGARRARGVQRATDEDIQVIRFDDDEPVPVRSARTRLPASARACRARAKGSAWSWSCPRRRVRR